MTVNVNDKVITKKSHPCGNDVWVVTRTGADYKLKCEKCGRTVMLTVTELEKRVKKVIKSDGI